MRPYRILLSLLVSIVATGCATPYQPHGMTGGFSETKINDSAYLVSFAGNGYASHERVHNFWLYRCAELTLANGYDYFVLRPATPQVSEAAGPVPAVYHPGNGHFVKVRGGGGGHVVIYGGGGGAVTTWASRAVVLMYKKPLPPEMLFALDAQVVRAELAPYVLANGQGTPPNSAVLFREAFVGHAQVDYGSLAPSLAIAPASPYIRPEPRSPQSIQEKLDNALLAFYAAYQEHQLRGHDATAGTVVLGFSVSPNGVVTDCHLVSSTIADPVFQSALLSRLRSIDFGAQDVPATTVSSFQMKFTPKAG